MKAVDKFFNTAGPIQSDIHYNVNPLSRIDLDELENLIRQQKYFILHAPRQTGKTSCLIALRDYLNMQGEYIAVYANIEAGQAARNDVLRVVTATASAIANRLSSVVRDNMPKEVLQDIKGKEGADSLLTAYLSEICSRLSKPLVLLIDEIDALVGELLSRSSSQSLPYKLQFETLPNGTFISVHIKSCRLITSTPARRAREKV